MKTYTVIGVYVDADYERYAESIEAESASDAEKKILDRAKAQGEEGLVIAGVVAGAVELADVHEKPA